MTRYHPLARLRHRFQCHPHGQSQSQRYRERIHEGYACVQRGETEEIKERAGRCHKRKATDGQPARLMSCGATIFAKWVYEECSGAAYCVSHR
eukprot:364484-Chlamydomonas_euryale.AAC.4